jgi:hypothetical protein
MFGLEKLIRKVGWLFRHRMQAKQWRRRLYDVPAPQKVKWAVLERHAIPGATWVETGTYKGDTTEFLAARAPMVYSVEPADALYQAVKMRFKNCRNVKLLHGPSETIFPSLVKQLRGDVCFWLDGHASGGDTFQGVSATPVMKELQEIEASLHSFSSIIVFVDDMRCFDPAIPEYADYPSRAALVQWAERQGMKWHIEHDIFVARRP